MGSDIRADDGVGLHVARQLQDRISSEHVDVIEIGTAGLGLLDSIGGYDRLILIDAIVTGATPGNVHQLEGVDVACASHLGPGHDADLPTVIALGKKLAGENMPRDVTVIAVEAADVITVSTHLTPAVEAAVPKAAARVAQLCG